jgi:hypothetical protein
MFLPRVIVGAALLSLGRKAFWLFVAGVGFVAGIYLATWAFQFKSDWAVLSAAVAGGLLGALLAMVFQSVGLGLAGFVGGGYAASTLFEAVGWGQRFMADMSYRSWVVFVVGGILGALLIGLLFDWALIALSSVIGAMLITQAVPIQGVGQALLFLVLVATGVVVQWILMRRDRSKRPGFPKGRATRFG